MPFLVCATYCTLSIEAAPFHVLYSISRRLKHKVPYISSLFSSKASAIHTKIAEHCLSINWRARLTSGAALQEK